MARMNSMVQYEFIVSFSQYWRSLPQALSSNDGDAAPDRLSTLVPRFDSLLSQLSRQDCDLNRE